MLRLYPDEEEVCNHFSFYVGSSRTVSQPQAGMSYSALQQEALEDGLPPEQYPEDMEQMDVSQANNSFPMFEDEDDILVQAAPTDTYLALQLLRSQFPAKARVGTTHDARN